MDKGRYKMSTVKFAGSEVADRFIGFKSLDVAIESIRSEINSAWRACDTLTGTDKDMAEAVAKKLSKDWLKKVKMAEAVIITDEARMSDYDDIARKLATVPDADRPEEFAELWNAVDAWRKGWLNFQGKYMDSCKFSRLSDYLRFREAIAMYINHPFISKFIGSVE